MKEKFTIKDNLYELMTDHNLKISELAEKLGIQYKTLSNYVNGIHSPSLKNAIKIADYFDCSLDFLVGLTNDFQTKNFSKPDNLFYQRYKKLIYESKISHYKVTKDLGLNINISRKWKKGATPTLTVLTKIAEYFGVSIDFLIGRK